MMMASKSEIVVAPLPVVCPENYLQEGCRQATRSLPRGQNPAWTRGRVAGLPPANSCWLYSRPHLPLSSGFRSPERRRRHEGRQAMAQALKRKLTSIDVSDPPPLSGRHLAAAVRAIAPRRSRALLRGLAVRAVLVGDALRRHLRSSSTTRTIRRVRNSAVFRWPTSRRGRSAPASSHGPAAATPPNGRTVAPIVAPSNLANFEALIRKRTSDVLDALPRNEPSIGPSGFRPISPT